MNRHNGKIPRDHWLEEWERRAILDFYCKSESDGYRRCTYMMIDQDVVYASPATVYRVLKAAGAMRKWNNSPTKKGTGFKQPLEPHQHWHMDVAYVRISGIYYYLISILNY